MDQVHIVGMLPVSAEVLTDAQWLDKAIVRPRLERNVAGSGGRA